MTTMRMLPPANGRTTTVGKRVYSAGPGSYCDVPDFDASILQANGWSIAALGGTGASTARPVNPPVTTQFHDTTLGYNIVWDGKQWRNPTSGAIV